MFGCWKIRRTYCRVIRDCPPLARIDSAEHASLKGSAQRRISHSSERRRFDEHANRAGCGDLPGMSCRDEYPVRAALPLSFINCTHCDHASPLFAPCPMTGHLGDGGVSQSGMRQRIPRSVRSPFSCPACCLSVMRAASLSGGATMNERGKEAAFAGGGRPTERRRHYCRCWVVFIWPR